MVKGGRLMKLSGKEKEVGYYIRLERENKELSQIKLAEAAFVSEREIRNLENGKNMPKIRILEDILEVFGKNFGDLIEFLFGDEETVFDNTFEEILELVYDEKVAIAQERYQSLVEMGYSEKIGGKYLLSMQFLASIFAEYPQQAFDILKKALVKHVPGVFKEGVVDKEKVFLDDFDFEFIESQTFDRVQYGVLVRLIGLISELLSIEKACELSYATIKSLENRKVKIEVRRSAYPALLFNHSNFLKDLKRYGECLDICQKGIIFLKNIKRTKVLAKFYYNQALSYAYLGDIEKASESYKLSIEQFKRDGEDTNAEYVRQWAKEKFGLTLN